MRIWASLPARRFRSLSRAGVHRAGMWIVSAIIWPLSGWPDSAPDYQHPPRTLKSVLVAQVFPTWVLARQRNAQFIGVSYAPRWPSAM